MQISDYRKASLLRVDHEHIHQKGWEEIHCCNNRPSFGRDVKLGVPRLDAVCIAGLNQLKKATMVAKRVETNSTISVFFCPLPPLPPYNVDLSQDMGSITLHWGTIRPTQYHIFKIQHCSVRRGLSFLFTG